MCSQKILSKLLLAIGLLAFFLPQNSYASSSKFMTLPFRERPILMQGWNYNFSNRAHQGIDYFSKVGTELLAVAGGSAKVGFQPGRNFVYGKYLILDHHNGYKSLYAHLSEAICVSNCDRGGVIAKSGMTGTDNQHLHFEVLSNTKYRDGSNRGHGWRVDPYDLYSTKNIYPPNAGFAGLGENNLWEGDYPNIFTPPPVPQKLTVVSSKQGSAELSWDECADDAFGRYELYRSEIGGQKGEKIATVEDAKKLNHLDLGLFAGQDYYFTLITFYKDGREVASNEVKINIPRETINLTNKTGVQQFVGISSGKVYWQDNVREQNIFPEIKTFHYYNLSEKVEKTITIGDPLDNRISGPSWPHIAGNWLCYVGKKSKYGKNEVFCRKLVAENLIADIQISLVGGRDPQVSEEGLVIWLDAIGGSLYWTNLNDGTEIRKIADAVLGVPRIWGKNAIYQLKETNSSTTLWITNIETGDKRILKSKVDIGFVDIWGDYATFTRDDKLYLININNPEEEILIDGNGHHNARIRDGKIVYSKSRQEGGSIIYVYLIPSRKTLVVTEPLKYIPAPVIFENMVAYDAAVEDSALNMDVFLTYL